MQKISNPLRAAIAALNFQDTRREKLRALTRPEWEEFLPLCDRMRLTLPLRQICSDDLPEWVRSRVDKNIQNNTVRLERIKVTYLELAHSLQETGIEHVVLKGFALWPSYMQDPRFRTQSDIDIFFPSDSVFHARDVLSTMGYEPIKGLEHQPTDHLPPMLRKTDWKWRGDYFDPCIPISLELHFRFWNETTTRLRPQGMDQFWVRRVERSLDGLNFPALHPVDSLGYAALHVLHHLLLGGLIPYHIYELAWFLHVRAEDAQFWNDWKSLHDSSLRQLEAIAFHMATDWFGCRLPEAIEVELQSLSPAVQQWFQRYHDSPLNALTNPNKDALWLHLSLLGSFRNQWAVFCGTLLPARVPPTEAIKHWSLRNVFGFIAYGLGRLAHHLRVLPATLWEGVCWWWSQKRGPSLSSAAHTEV